MHYKVFRSPNFIPYASNWIFWYWFSHRVKIFCESFNERDWNCLCVWILWVKRRKSFLGEVLYRLFSSCCYTLFRWGKKNKIELTMEIRNASKRRVAKEFLIFFCRRACAIIRFEWVTTFEFSFLGKGKKDEDDVNTHSSLKFTLWEKGAYFSH